MLTKVVSYYKVTCTQVLVWPDQRVVGPAADDDFAMYQNAHVDKCLCCQAHV